MLPDGSGSNPFKLITSPMCTEPEILAEPDTPNCKSTCPPKPSVSKTITLLRIPIGVDSQ